jgi:hypothetical protein
MVSVATSSTAALNGLRSVRVTLGDEVDADLLVAPRRWGRRTGAGKLLEVEHTSLRTRMAKWTTSRLYA